MATLNERLEAFALAFKDDPDFNRIPFPDHILAKLGIVRKEKDLSAVGAVDYAFNATSRNNYTGPLVTIDQSETVKTFPNLVELADSIKANETKNQESSDLTSSPEPCDAASTTPSSSGLEKS
jgi:hypothetical protein